MKKLKLKNVALITHRRGFGFRCTCALVPWMPAIHAAAAICLYTDVLKLSGCPNLSSELLPCSPAPGTASSEEGQKDTIYTCLSHPLRAENTVC